MQRPVATIVPAQETLEGAGFLVHRPFPVPGHAQFDPFLLLDEMGPMEFAPGQAQGAPDHPHRGFETVTYLLSGKSTHADSHGHRGTLEPGDVQWMTAGAGIVHAEMPAQEIVTHGGRMHGFQIWVNLPRADKMMAPRYQEIKAADVPVHRNAEGTVVERIIAGEAHGTAARTATRTPILVVHATLAPKASTEIAVPDDWTALAYVAGGTLAIPGRSGSVGRANLVVFGSGGDAVALANAGNAPLDVLVLAGAPIGEPMARYGPFVMNSIDELETAFRDFAAGRFGEIPATVG